MKEEITARTIEKNRLNPSCRDRACAAGIAKLDKAERVIYGTVVRTRVSYNQQLDTRGAQKYLLQEQGYEVYVITLHLVDAENNRDIATVTETAGIKTMDSDITRIVQKLQAYYRSADEEELEKTEEIKKAEKAKKEEEARKSEVEKKARDNRRDRDVKKKIAGTDKDREVPRQKNDFLFYMLPSGFVPLGPIRSMTRAGLGFTISLGGTYRDSRNVSMRFQVGYYYNFEDAKRIKNFHMINMAIQAGYTFRIPKNFSITPLAGIGTIIHVITRDTSRIWPLGIYSFSVGTYFDSFFPFKCEMAYHINDNHAIVLVPGFSFFTEKNGAGIMFTAEAGYRLRL